MNGATTRVQKVLDCLWVTAGYLIAPRKIEAVARVNQTNTQDSQCISVDTLKDDTRNLMRLILWEEERDGN